MPFLRHPRLAVVAGGIALATALSGCSATSTAASDSHYNASVVHAAVAITPRLAGADNFRDIGGIGAGYATTDGRHVKRGVVYRSNALTLKPADIATLEPLGVTAIYDLRTPTEIAEKPDSAVAGANWTNIDVIGQAGAAAPSFTTAAEATTMMETTYRRFVSNSDSRAALAKELTDIANGTGAQIIHCTAGKDRTGWSTALLLHVAGVSQDVIDQDYLLSNQYSRASVNGTLAGITEKQGAAAAAVYAPLLGVQQSFLDAAYDQVDKDYGSVDKYLAKGLGLTQKTLAKLKARLVG